MPHINNPVLEAVKVAWEKAKSENNEIKLFTWCVESCKMFGYKSGHALYNALNYYLGAIRPKKEVPLGPSIPAGEKRKRLLEKYKVKEPVC